MDTDRRSLVAAIPRPASGPGWANQPLLLLWVSGGEYTVEYVQPEDQSPQVRVLYSVAAKAISDITRWHEAARANPPEPSARRQGSEG